MTASPAHLEHERLTAGPVPLSELRRTVCRYARNPNLAVLLPETTERTWARLAGDRRLDVWLISWPEGTETGWHDHGEATGAFTVASGRVVEETWALSAAQHRLLVADDVRTFGRGHVHNVRGAGPGRALTVHAYSPALVTMTPYVLDAAGPTPTEGSVR